MPGQTPPAGGMQGFWARFQELSQRITSLETWQRQMSVGASPWIAPTLAANWSQVSGSSETVGYLKDPLGFVHLRGVIKKSSAWTVLETVLTLPAGFRPAGTGLYTGFLWDATNSFLTAAWNIQAGGAVLLDSIPRPGTPGIVNEVGLSGITFLAEH